MLDEILHKLEFELNNCERCVTINKAIQALRAIPRKRGKKLSSESIRAKIERIIANSNNGSIFTPKLVMKQLNCSKRMAYNQLATFAKTGLLRRIKSGTYVRGQAK